MKKITQLLTLLFFIAFALKFETSHAQSTFFYDDFRYFTNSGFTAFDDVDTDGTLVTVTANTTYTSINGTVPSELDLGFTRPTNNIGTRTDTKDTRRVRIQGNSGSANYEGESWAIMDALDISYFHNASVTFASRNEYKEGTNDNPFQVLIGFNYTDGTDPSTVTWTDVTADIVDVQNTFGQDGVWAVSSLDLSSHIATANSDKFVLAFKYEFHDVGAFDSSTNRNGTWSVSDVKFTFTPLDVSIGSISLNVDTGAKTNIFDEPYAASGNNNTNFNPRYFDRLFTTTTYSTRFKSDQIIPVNEGPVFKVSTLYNPIIVSEVKYSLRNAAKDGVNATSWKIEASNDGSSWTDVGGGAFTPIQDANSDTAEQTRATDTGNTAYRYYRMVLASKLAAADNTGFIEFQEANFTTIAATLSTSTNRNQMDLIAYPNPANSVLNLSHSSEVESVRLVDVTGKTIYHHHSTQAIDVSSYSNGIYILQIKAKDKKVYSTKVVIN